MRPGPVTGRELVQTGRPDVRVGRRPELVVGVVDEPVVPVRLVVNSAGVGGFGGWRGRSAYSAQQLRLVRETTEVAALQETCFDVEPILQDPASEALEPT
jgi:hypothetical protein